MQHEMCCEGLLSSGAIRARLKRAMVTFAELIRMENPR